MSIPLPHWVRCETVENVTVPSRDCKSPAETIQVTVPAWKDPEDGEIYLDGESIRILDDVRARHLGLMSSGEIKDLRQSLRLTQKRLSELLQIGEKTWTRWESGRERPSKSMNVAICALRDGRIDVPYLESLLAGNTKTSTLIEPVTVQSADAVLWSELLTGLHWKSGEMSKKPTDAVYTNALSQWIDSMVKDFHFSYETKDWQHTAISSHPENVIPFQKAS